MLHRCLQIFIRQPAPKPITSLDEFDEFCFKTEAPLTFKK